jgi:hypothetical protein
MSEKLFSLKSLSTTLTHAIQSPCVLQLIFAPCSGDRPRLFLTKMRRKLLRYRLRRQKGPVSVEGYDCFVCHCGHIT